MFCPNCRAEYRPGFARCSDCDVELVENLPPPNTQDPDLKENERPDLASTRFFLAWFIPMCIYLVLFFGVRVRPFLFQNIYIAVFFVCFTFIANIGGFWMIYQAVRYERRVWRYVLLAFIPFMFVWYSLVRVPRRKEFQGKSEFIR
jgi:hypothetical protein